MNKVFSGCHDAVGASVETSPGSMVEDQGGGVVEGLYEAVV